MTKLSAAGLALVACAGIAVPCRIASAQEKQGQGSATDLTYENGRITSQFLPYSRPFTISGPLTTSKGVADVVMAEQWEGTIVPAGTVVAPRDSSCWIRPRDATPPATTFKLAFDKVLKLERRYTFHFTFGRSFDPDALREATRRALTELGDTIRLRSSRLPPGPALSNAQADTLLGKSIDRELERISGTGARWITVKREGVCALSPDPPPVPVPPVSADVLAEAAASQADLREAQAGRGTALKALQEIPDSVVTRVADALRTLHERRTNAVGNAAPGFTGDDISDLVRALQTADAAALPPDNWNRLNTLTMTPGKSPAGGTLRSADQQDLTTLLNAIEELRVRTAEVSLRQPAATAAVQALDAIALPTGGIYVPIAEASITGTVWGAEADVRKLQIGTVVGGSSAVLNTGGSSKTDGVMYVALRFYLDAVDRSLPEPWSSNRARWAIDVGSLYKSKLRYRGQEQDEAFGGLTPVVGLSYDFSRYIALNGGIVIFRQPSVNPTNGGKDKPFHSAPYVGVGVDFDALNQLRALLAK